MEFPGISERIRIFTKRASCQFAGPEGTESDRHEISALARFKKRARFRLETSPSPSNSRKCWSAWDVDCNRRAVPTNKLHFGYSRVPCSEVDQRSDDTIFCHNLRKQTLPCRRDHMHFQSVTADSMRDNSQAFVPWISERHPRSDPQVFRLVPDHLCRGAEDPRFDIDSRSR